MFARYLAASGLANLADGIALLAWVWVASLLTRDAALIALVPVALRLPWALAAIPAGLVADRVDRRRLVVAMDALRAAAFGAAALALVLRGPLPVPPADGLSFPGLFVFLCVCAALVGLAEVFRDNAAQTLLPSLVETAGLERANARQWLIESLANQLVGPMAGAFLLGAAVALPFGANAAIYAAAGLLMASFPGRYRPTGAAPSGWRAALGEAWTFLRNQPLLLLLAAITGVWNLCFEATMFALVLHAQENLGLSAPEYGVVLAGFAAGGVLAGLIGHRIGAHFGAGRTMGAALVLSAAALLAVPLMPGLWSLVALIILFELSGITWNIHSVSLRQRLVPDAIRGRVNSLYRLLAWGMMPVGLALSGLSIEWATPGLGRSQALMLPMWLSGGFMLVVGLLTVGPLVRGMAGAAGSRA